MEEPERKPPAATDEAESRRLGRTLGRANIPSIEPIRRAVRGFGPYILGMPFQAVFAADGTLSRGSWPVWDTRLPTLCVGRYLRAPAGGVQYPARLGLQFWQDALAVIIVDWPAQSFDAPEAWRTASRGLRDELIALHSPEIVTLHNLHDDGLMLIEAVDRGGDRLIAAAVDKSISLIYVQAVFERALGAAVPPKSPQA